MNNREKGSAYEEQAGSFFERSGCMILERNYRRKTGEIDLIVKDPENCLVFVEVKYRKNDLKGDPLEAITKSKQMRIFRTAKWYLTEHGLPESTRCRFDAVSILGSRLKHVKNAFGGL